MKLPTYVTEKELIRCGFRLVEDRKGIKKYLKNYTDVYGTAEVTLSNSFIHVFIFSKHSSFVFHSGETNREIFMEDIDYIGQFILGIKFRDKGD